MGLDHVTLEEAVFVSRDQIKVGEQQHYFPIERLSLEGRELYDSVKNGQAGIRVLILGFKVYGAKTCDDRILLPVQERGLPTPELDRAHYLLTGTKDFF